MPAEGKFYAQRQDEPDKRGLRPDHQEPREANHPEFVDMPDHHILIVHDTAELGQGLVP